MVSHNLLQRRCQSVMSMEIQPGCGAIAFRVVGLLENCAVPTYYAGASL
mgnify:CR=1 FL=1